MKANIVLIVTANGVARKRTAAAMVGRDAETRSGLFWQRTPPPRQLNFSSTHRHAALISYTARLPPRLHLRSPAPPATLTAPTMVRRHISDETKQIALQMAQEGLPTKAIRDRTGISERSVMRLKRTFRETGSVSRKALVIGRKRMLDILDVCVSYTCVCVERALD